MDYRLLFTQRALNDLAEIIAYIAQDDPEAASRFGDSLLDHIELLTRFRRWETSSDNVRACANYNTARSRFITGFARISGSSKCSTYAMGQDLFRSSKPVTTSKRLVSAPVVNVPEVTGVTSG